MTQPAKQLGATPENGDFAAGAPDDGTPASSTNAPPRPRREVMSWFLALLAACVWASLGLLALSEHRIVLGGRRGESLYEGWAAMAVGFLLLGTALYSLLLPFLEWKWGRWLGLIFLIIWLGALAVYWFQQHQV